MERQKPILLKLEELSLHPLLLDAIQKGTNVTGIYDELPLEELLALDDLRHEYPGLRWILRKQRGRYLLTVLKGRKLDLEHVKGEP
jgi:hypothetical protein